MLKNFFDDRKLVDDVASGNRIEWREEPPQGDVALASLFVFSPPKYFFSEAMPVKFQRLLPLVLCRPAMGDANDKGRPRVGFALYGNCPSEHLSKGLNNIESESYSQPTEQGRGLA